jgi:hypothetical protein
MADSKNNAHEKHMWHDMSASWLGMIGHAEGEEFATEERQHGTRQPKSNCSLNTLTITKDQESRAIQRQMAAGSAPLKARADANGVKPRS